MSWDLNVPNAAAEIRGLLQAVIAGLNDADTEGHPTKRWAAIADDLQCAADNAEMVVEKLQADDHAETLRANEEQGEPTDG